MSKIIKLNPDEVAPLTPDQVNKLGGAIVALQDLNAAVVKTPANEAQAKGLQQYITETLQLHATEFIGMWFTAYEYRGLVQSQARHERRVEAFKHAIAKHEFDSAAAEATPAEPTE